MTALELLRFLKTLRGTELNKQVRFELAPLQSWPLLDFDDADPDYVWLKGCVEPASEN